MIFIHKNVKKIINKNFSKNTQEDLKKKVIDIDFFFSELVRIFK